MACYPGFVVHGDPVRETPIDCLEEALMRARRLRALLTIKGLTVEVQSLETVIELMRDGLGPLKVQALEARKL